MTGLADRLGNGSGRKDAHPAQRRRYGRWHGGSHRMMAEKSLPDASLDAGVRKATKR